MEIHCTRPGCSRPQNFFADLDNKATLQTAQQKYCTACGMPLILAGRYLPSKLLGKGGFGAAFLARDRYTPTMRHCVVKQFQPAGDLNPQQLTIAQNLFEREAEVLEQLGSAHPQIPDLYAFFPLSVASPYQVGKEEQFFYLVQEFIDGQNLEEELQTKGKFSEASILEVLREILQVLKFVHENGTIHRDIKPSNIMRHRNGRLYLLDFGAVKQVTTGAAGTPGGRSTGIYSMGFAPPEQMAGAQVYPSTDLYALAVTAIVLLTGQKPEDLYDSYNNSWNWRSYARVSNILADVLDRMLLPAPNQRFQSAQEVLDALALQPTPPPPVTQPPNTSHTPHPPTQQPTPVSPIHTPNPPPIPAPPKRFAFSVLEILAGAAFTGFEGALLFIALGSLLPVPGISMGLWGMIMGGMIFAQFRRIIEKFDFLIIAGISLSLVVFFQGLRAGFPVPSVLALSVLAGAGAIAVTALFRLIYLLLSRFL
ncbi:MAG TPA: serine/threonine protein kinase [Cyanobacteria bacterium UBA8803]|nr:serine/threonine protein kinase [Cyanobacteria bacterium UBA9273]HBL57609.1 serine/threonine protein kinase [Cyanobacteria bacterium UBA8803]